MSTEQENYGNEAEPIIALYENVVPTDKSISFHIIRNAEPPILEIRSNGDILVRGEFSENNTEIVEALREYAKTQL